MYALPRAIVQVCPLELHYMAHVCPSTWPMYARRDGGHKALMPPVSVLPQQPRLGLGGAARARVRDRTELHDGRERRAAFDAGRNCGGRVAAEMNCRWPVRRRGCRCRRAAAVAEGEGEGGGHITAARTATAGWPARRGGRHAARGSGRRALLTIICSGPGFEACRSGVRSHGKLPRIFNKRSRSYNVFAGALPAGRAVRARVLPRLTADCCDLLAPAGFITTGQGFSTYSPEYHVFRPVFPGKSGQL
jgi:hypothetical protein